MSMLRSFNWAPVLFGLFFVGMGYLIQYFSTSISEVSGHISSHALAWRLLIPGALVGYIAWQPWGQNALYRMSVQPLRFIYDSVGCIASVSLLLATMAAMLLIGANSLESSPRAVRFATISDIVFWASSSYLIFYAWFIWIRYIVKEDTIVSINGQFFYPGTKFILYPWRRYSIELFHRVFGFLENVPMTIQCMDGVYQITLCTSFAIDIERAGTVVNAGSFNAEEISADVKKRIITHLTEEAKYYTLGQFLQLKRDTMRYEIAGIPFIWNGKITIAIK